MNNKRVLLCLAVMWTAVFSALSQERMTVKESINEIKSQSDIYYWEQFNSYQLDSAKLHATQLLLSRINENRPKRDRLTYDDLAGSGRVSSLSVDRGSQVQCFVYIRKDEVNAITSSASAESRSDDMYFASAPAKKSKQETTAPPPVNVHVTEKPRPSAATIARKKFVPDAFVQRVMQTGSFANVIRLLKSMKAEGKLQMFGKLSDIDDYSFCDLILFDMKSQEIVTMLSAENNDGRRTNMVSGEEDTLDNYPKEMTAVIWYIK